MKIVTIKGLWLIILSALILISRKTKFHENSFLSEEAKIDFSHFQNPCNPLIRIKDSPKSLITSIRYDLHSIFFSLIFFRGIPYISKNRVGRMKAIAEQFCSENYDVVCLQEIWSIHDYKLIKAKTQEKLPYTHYFYR